MFGCGCRVCVLPDHVIVELVEQASLAVVVATLSFVDDDLAEAALAHLRSEFRAREIDADERERRDHEGQRRLLDKLDDDVIREYADTIATTERS